MGRGKRGQCRKCEIGREKGRERVGVSLLVTRLTTRQLLCTAVLCSALVCSAVSSDCVGQWHGMPNIVERGSGVARGRGDAKSMPHCTVLKPTCQCDSSQAGNRQALMYLTNSTWSKRRTQHLSEAPRLLAAPPLCPCAPVHCYATVLAGKANFFNWLSQRGSVKVPQGRRKRQREEESYPT